MSNSSYCAREKRKLHERRCSHSAKLRVYCVASLFVFVCSDFLRGSNEDFQKVTQSPSWFSVLNATFFQCVVFQRSWLGQRTGLLPQMKESVFSCDVYKSCWHPVDKTLCWTTLYSLPKYCINFDTIKLCFLGFFLQNQKFLRVFLRTSDSAHRRKFWNLTTVPR